MIYFGIGFTCFFIGIVTGMLLLGLCASASNNDVEELDDITDNVYDKSNCDPCRGCLGAANNDCGGCNRSWIN